MKRPGLIDHVSELATLLLLTAIAWAALVMFP